MTDGFTDNEAPAAKTRKPRAPYVRTGLDAELLAVRQINAKLQKLPSDASRQRALKMISEYVGGGSF